MRSSISVTLKRDCRQIDYWPFRQPSFKLVVYTFAFRKAEALTIVMNNDGNVIGIVESNRSPFEGRIIETPCGRSQPPNKLVEIAPVLFVTRTTTLGCKIELVPPREFGLGRQG